MKLVRIISLCSVFLLLSCDKKNKEPVNDTAETPVSGEDTLLTCKNLPPTPKPFGWQDTLTNEEKNVNTFIYNPLNADQLLYMVNGSIFGGYNKLYLYTIPSQQSLLLGSNLAYLPQVNKQGWIVYSDDNSNIYKVKVNGDSATQMSGNMVSENPHWDHSGNFIYYFQKPKDNISAQIVKISKDGNYNASFFADLPYILPLKKSNKIIYLKIKNNTQVTLILRDMENPNETDLISGPIESAAGVPNFGNLCIDNADQNFFWSNSNGIFSCNLASLKVDTLFKNCENFIYDHPLVSFKENELYYVHHIKKALTKYKLLHIYKAMELNLLSKQSSEVKIFP